ncbi:MAG: rRNA methyltransferase [Micavibrio sp.]|nr:rRNA methyltransferase [Micavibrio sp.]|tara:strand:- start:1049 stop:1717 length:669 start_codon:yes stop_codon:yes gene_type:complete
MAPRNKHTRVKTARGRKSSSTRWLQRQLNDPYVKEAKRLGYRSRAAFKLIEMEEKLNIIKKDMLVVDLGAAPGGWTQVAVEKGAKHVIGIDLLEIEDMEGAEFIQMDFTDNEAPEKLLEMLGGEKPDMVISDLSPYTTGHKKTDHLKIMALVEMAYDFAAQVLKPGGHFIAKVFQGGAQSDLLKMVKADFETVKHMKPPASRKGSPEQYLVALDFRKNVETE